MSTSLLFYGALGLASTAFAFWANRRLFVGGRAGPVTVLEGRLLRGGARLAMPGLVLQRPLRPPRTGTGPPTGLYQGAVLQLGGSTRPPRTTPSSTWSSCRCGPSSTAGGGDGGPWIFFVMSLFTSLAFAVAFYLAFVERQIRYNREEPAVSSTSYPQL